MKRFIALLTAFLLSVLILPFAAFATDGSLARFTSDKQALTFTDVSSGDRFAPEDCMAIIKVGAGQKSCLCREWFASRAEFFNTVLILKRKFE